MLIRELYPAIERDYLIHRKRTLHNVECSWRKHLLGFFGEQEIAPFRPSRIQSYILARRAEQAANGTINRELAYLKHMANLAIQNYEAEVEDEKLLAALVRWGRIKLLDESENVREQIFPTELYDAFAVETAKVGLWFRGLFEIAYTHGWRKGELTSLTVNRVDLVRRTIRLSPKQTKNKRYREIGMTEKEHELLSLCVAGKAATDYVFTRERTAHGRKPLNGGHIVDFRKDWKKVCDAVGVKAGRADGIIPHDLRRTGATNLIDAGFDEKEAMTQTGHLTPSTFRRYHQVSAAKLQEAARKIERAHRERQRLAKFQQAEMFGVDPSRKPS
jgi:integrase